MLKKSYHFCGHCVSSKTESCLWFFALLFCRLLFMCCRLHNRLIPKKFTLIFIVFTSLPFSAFQCCWSVGRFCMCNDELSYAMVDDDFSLFFMFFINSDRVFHLRKRSKSKKCWDKTTRKINAVKKDEIFSFVMEFLFLFRLYVGYGHEILIDAPTFFYPINWIE